MKKALMVMSLLVFSSLFSIAQDMSSYRTALKEMMVASGAERTYHIVVDGMINTFESQKSNVPEEFWKEVRSELSKTAIDELVDLVLPVYQRYLDEKDLKAATAFYRSPAGKKLADNTPLITKESMALGQEWGRKIGETVVEKLKAKGF